MINITKYHDLQRGSLTLLGYCLRRSSFKLQGAHVALSPTNIDDIRAVERNAEVLLNACKDIGLAHRQN